MRVYPLTIVMAIICLFNAYLSNGLNYSISGILFDSICGLSLLFFSIQIIREKINGYLWSLLISTLFFFRLSVLLAYEFSMLKYMPMMCVNLLTLVALFVTLSEIRPTVSKKS